jgi:ribosomal protein L3
MPEHIASLILAKEGAPKERHVPPLEPRPYARDSKRCGAIAIKAGMTQEWDEWGVRLPLTVLWIDDCEVVRVKTAVADGVDALVLGVGSKKEKQLRKPQLGEYRSLGIAPKAKLAEFSVTPDGLLPPGTRLGAAHFVAGGFEPEGGWGAGLMRSSAACCWSGRAYAAAGVHCEDSMRFPSACPGRGCSWPLEAAAGRAPRPPPLPGPPSEVRSRPPPGCAGQHLDVTGTSKGKGFQGVMKRWGMKGGPASHGATKVGRRRSPGAGLPFQGSGSKLLPGAWQPGGCQAYAAPAARRRGAAADRSSCRASLPPPRRPQVHRAPGAIGTRNWPGRVWKGKKMAGREGHDRVTVKNVWVYKVGAAQPWGRAVCGVCGGGVPWEVGAGAGGAVVECWCAGARQRMRGVAPGGMLATAGAARHLCNAAF